MNSIYNLSTEKRCKEFCSEAMLYDNRSFIKIVMHPKKVSQVIDSNEIFDPVNKEEDINILKINYDLYNYDISSSREKIATLNLDPGKIQTVMFPNPVDPGTIESDIGLKVILKVVYCILKSDL